MEVRRSSLFGLVIVWFTVYRKYLRHACQKRLLIAMLERTQSTRKSKNDPNHSVAANLEARSVSILCV